MNKRNKREGNKPSKKNSSDKGKKRALPLKEELKRQLDYNPSKSYTVKELAKLLDLNHAAGKNIIKKVLFELVAENVAVQESRSRFASAQQPDLIEGKIDHVNPRFAFLLMSDDDGEDLLIKSKYLKGAFHGDTVKAVITKVNDNGRKEAKVISVVKRDRTQFVGRLEMSLRYGFVVPDNRYIHDDFYVRRENLAGAKHNDKVIVEVITYPEEDMKAEARVVSVLGKAGENETEIHSIMVEFGLPLEFPEKVLADAGKIPGEISGKEIASRRDMREKTTFTIDPEDAKDFDDAISFEYLDNGNYEIGVHIADVTHYVQLNSQLEKEAHERATSVYLVDRTIPMLPERLSNELCSLRPNEDKLTFSAVFEITPEADIANQWFGRTVTHSDRRFTYEEAQEVLETTTGDFSKELLLLNDLAKKMKITRFKKGAINFETVEVKFRLDEKGRPLGIIPKVRKDAHKLVEEFMLLANKKVAEYVATLGQKKYEKTFVYRSHEHPDPEKLSNFSLFAKRFGHELKIEETAISKSLNKLMSEIEGKPEQNILESLAIRAMAKAKYTTQSSFHFGLAFPYYTHFTSPIRRYPDMMVHRLLAHYLEGGKPPKEEEYEKKCEHASEREKRAADAERASVKYKQVEFMQSVEDKVFEGVVSGVTEWGVFVEIIETKCEGMVRLSDMDDDFYDFDEKNYRIIGQRNKRMITLGDQVKVVVSDTDIDRRTIDLEFVWD